MLYKLVQGFESVDELFKCDFSQMKASDRYFPLVLSAVGGGSNVWVLYEITVLFKRFANSSSLFEYASLSRLRVLSRTIHEQICTLLCLTASHAKDTSIC